MVAQMMIAKDSSTRLMAPSASNWQGVPEGRTEILAIDLSIGQAPNAL